MLHYPTPVKNIGSYFIVFVGLILTLSMSAYTQSRISGHLNYLNSENTSMDGVSIFLLNTSSQILDSVKSDAQGFYSFNNLSNNIYYVIPQCIKPWGGANSVDAMLAQKHYVGLSLLEGLRLKSADVDLSNSVNSADALLILKRFVGMITSFDAGDWAFENNAITVDGINNVTHDFYGLCFGDINGSFIPAHCSPSPTLANAGPDISASSETTLNLNGNAPIIGSGLWKVISGSTYSLTYETLPNAIFSGVPGNAYLLTWNITTNCYTSIDTVEISFSPPPVLPCPGIPTFVYDGQTYNTVQIGTQCWMKENLNVGTMIPGSSDQTDNQGIEKYCFNDLPDNCVVYGGLYQWDEAMQYTLNSGAQGICPGGWHMPTDEEWNVLTDLLGGPSVAGAKLKEAGLEHWFSPNTGATNASGFTALGAGYRTSNGYFDNQNYDAFFWTSLEQGLGAFDRMVNSYMPDIITSANLKPCGFSVRCLKDTCTILPDQSNAGPDQILIGSQTTLNGNLPINGVGMWSIIAGNGGILLEPWYNQTEFWGVAGNSYQLVWTVSNYCNSSSKDTVKITFTIPTLICGDSINYGGQEYHIVKIGDQCWMKENLNIGEMIQGTQSQSNNGIIEKYCYDNDPANCTVYGGLYLWDELMQYVTTVETQGICPQGFHVPSLPEVGVMFISLGGNAFVGPSSKVKEADTTHWSAPNYGTNESGFTALPAGIQISPIGWFAGLQSDALFWISDLWVDTSYSNAFNINTEYRPNDVYWNPQHRNLGGSLRCLKNPCNSIPDQSNAGPDHTLNGNTMILEANTPLIGIGIWSIVSGIGGIITEIYNPQSEFSGLPGSTYQLVWIISTECRLTTDTVTITFLSPPMNTPCPGIPTLDYGGQTYNTVKIGTQCWMKENLNIGTMINGSDNQSDNSVIEKFCFNNEPENCAIYGGMYQWNEMMQYSLIPGGQGICPVGWHLPTDAEWCTLSTFLDATVNCSLMAQWTGSNIGGLLKEEGNAHWIPNFGATNESGFTALGAGYRYYYNAQFYGIQADAYFWCSDLFSNGNAYNRTLYNYGNTISRLEGSHENGYSVRCLKD